MNTTDLEAIATELRAEIERSADVNPALQVTREELIGLGRLVLRLVEAIAPPKPVHGINECAHHVSLDLPCPGCEVTWRCKCGNWHRDDLSQCRICKETHDDTK